jgi:GH18 family chitinase
MGLDTTSFSQTRVVAYIPTWANFPGIVNTADLTKVTHLNIAFSNPNSSGALTGVSAGNITTVVNAAHAKNVKVLMSIGGAGAPASTYSSLLSNANTSNNFVAQLVQYAVSNNLDGIDIDIEGDVLDGSNVTASQYQTFVTQLAAALHAKNKIMTAALATWFGDYVTNTAAAQFDFINVMSYDAAIPGTGDAPGQHSSYQFAVDDFNYWHGTKGVPGAKLTVGLPFYGYGWGTYAQPGNNEFAYVDIVNQYPGAENNDQVGSGSNAIYYNGIPTIKKKTAFAIANASGVMIWELTEDAPGAKSLLSAINQVITGTITNQPPTVSITSPANNTSFTAPASITINATAADADGTVSKVDFYNGSTLLGTDATSPYSFVWTNVAAGSYVITAKATDNSNVVTTSSAVNITVTNPATESPYGGTAWVIPGKIEAENYDLGGQGLAYNDNTAANQGGAYRTDGVDIEACSDTGAGYDVGYIVAGEWLNYTVNVTTAGTYSLSMRVAAITAGLTFHVELNGTNISGPITVPNTGGWQNWQTVTVNNISLTAGQKILKVAMDSGNFNINYFTFASTTTVNQPPTVSITSPANNASFTAPASITITANAADADGTVSKVDFYNGTVLLGTDATSPYSLVWTNVATGTYALTVKATDNANAVTTSSVVNVTVTTVTVNQPPTVSLTSPANNASFSAPASITINATAADVDGSVSKVDFYNGSTLLFSDATSPYSYNWTNVAAGSYSITAKATDNAGASTTSSVVKVVVNAVVSNSCTGIANYVENGGYVAGSKVQNAGSQYQCKPYPYSGWCNGAAWAYGPGTGSYWTDAWTLVGSCSSAARSADDASSVSSSMISNNPNPFVSTTTINVSVAEAGEVSVMVYDKTGQVVGVVVETYLAAGTYAYGFDASHLKADVYFVKCHSASGVATQKMIKVQ